MEEGGGVSRPHKAPVPGRGRELPRRPVLYSTIWSRFQKLRLLTFCFTQKISLLDLLLDIISKALLTFPRKVEGSKGIYPSQWEAAVFMEIGLFKTPKAIGGLWSFASPQIQLH